MGCHGGNCNFAFTYVKGHPLMGWSEYPYTTRGGSYRYNRSKVIGRVSGYTNAKTLLRNKEAALKGAVAAQPI